MTSSYEDVRLPDSALPMDLDIAMNLENEIEMDITEYLTPEQEQEEEQEQSLPAPAHLSSPLYLSNDKHSLPYPDIEESEQDSGDVTEVDMQSRLDSSTESSPDTSPPLSPTPKLSSRELPQMATFGIEVRREDEAVIDPTLLDLSPTVERSAAVTAATRTLLPNAPVNITSEGDDNDDETEDEMEIETTKTIPLNLSNANIPPCPRDHPHCTRLCTLNLEPPLVNYRLPQATRINPNRNRNANTSNLVRPSTIRERTWQAAVTARFLYDEMKRQEASVGVKERWEDVRCEKALRRGASGGGYLMEMWRRSRVFVGSGLGVGDGFLKGDVLEELDEDEEMGDEKQGGC